MMQLIVHYCGFYCNYCSYYCYYYSFALLHGVHVAFVVVYNIAAAVDHDGDIVAVVVVVVQCYIDPGTLFDFANDVGDASVVMENRAP